MKNIKTYSRLIQMPTYEERLKYLYHGKSIGEETFGILRYLNQKFYRSKEWKDCRRHIIVRDNGCDLGLKDYLIIGRILVHHIEPLTIDDIKNGSEKLLDPNNLITVSEFTHNQITHGAPHLVVKKLPRVRSVDDTTPWKRKDI